LAAIRQSNYRHFIPLSESVVLHTKEHMEISGLNLSFFSFSCDLNLAITQKV